MIICVSTPVYEKSQYGRPWIAKVDFPLGAKSEFKFGQWHGKPGEAGMLEIEADEGDIIAIGQKNFQKKPSVYMERSSSTEYNIVLAGNELDAVPKHDAVKHFRENRKAYNPLAKFGDQELIEELKARDYSIKANAIQTLKALAS